MRGRVGVEEGRKRGRVEEGNERGRNITIGIYRASEIGEGGSERRREGVAKRGRGTGRNVVGREIEREGNFKGCRPTLMMTLTNIEYTLLKTTHNADLALETFVLGMKHSEHV